MELAIWKDENQPPNISKAEIQTALSDMGVDWVKHPKILNIKAEVDKIAHLTNYI